MIPFAKIIHFFQKHTIFPIFCIFPLEVSFLIRTFEAMKHLYYALLLWATIASAQPAATSPLTN